MPRFVWKVKDGSGKEQIQEVEANTAAESKERIVAQGSQPLQLMQDDIGTTAGDLTQEATKPELRHNLSAEELLKLQESAPGFLSDLWRSFRQGLMWNLAFIALSAWHLYEQSYLWAAAFATPVVILPAVNWWFGIPLRLYEDLNRAKTWSRWEEVLVLADRLESRGGIVGIAVPKYELARCRSQALASLGRMDEAVKTFEPFLRDPKIERWMFLSYMSEIYDHGKKYDEALALRKEAVNENPDSMLTHIDLALQYAHRMVDPVNARKALEPVDVSLVAAMALPFLTAIEGMILCAENNHAAARDKLESALKQTEKYRQQAAMEGLILLTESYHCLALAKTGRFEEARENWEEISGFLTAAEEHVLLRKIESSLGNAG